MRPTILRASLLILASSLVAACDDSSSVPPGSSDAPEYVSHTPGSSSHGTYGAEGTDQAGGTKGVAPTTVNGATTPTAQVPGATAVPGGRVAEVKEADVYKVAGGKLFLLNTYRGFMVYDISNTKKPVQLGRLPVYGYPVEMFVENNTVYALLSNSLYLTKTEGKLQFQRRNSSQIVTIDISDPTSPRLLQAQDLAGELREGVARKIENTIYVVSYQPTGYWYWAWGPQNGEQPNEQAWVYSFDASTPSNLQQVGKLKIFEGGSTSTYDSVTGESHSRYSNGVSLSATSNAIMVVQSWYSYDSVPPKDSGGTGGRGGGDVGVSACWSYKNDQESVVSIVDVSDPTGVIRVAASFATAGSLGDQFKQTYVYDAQAKTGTYLGIFARNQWIGDGCNYTQQTQNTLESWNLNGDGTATLLSAVDFGKPNETVRGSYFDVDRKVAFAITARSMDPMYSISFADRSKLTILSAIDGLSGDMDLFRPVEGGQYLLAVGRDTGSACVGYGGGSDADKTANWNNQISVSLIDVRNLSKIRMVERKCLDIANAGWVGSDVTWNLDQAHKMIGLESDGTTSVLTVPVSYSVQDANSGDGWYYYRYETAVGIMSWDLSKYQDTLPPEQQNVIATHGHFVHPNGEVKRSVVYQQESTKQREMLNISDSHLSFANIQNLDAPVLDSVVEVASADQAVFRFGDYVVQQIALPSNDYRWTAYEFRVKAAGSELADAPTLARFTVGQVQQVLRHGNHLVMIQLLQDPTSDGRGNTTYSSQAVVFDLTNPLVPKAVGRASLPADLSPYGSYYRYYCGGLGYYGGYYYGYTQGMAIVDEGIAFLIQNVDYSPRTVELPGGGTTTEYGATYKQNLAFLDLRDPTRPTASEVALSLPGVGASPAETANLVADGMATDSFYLTYRVLLGSAQDPTTKDTIYSYANYAQRWQRKSGAWATESAVNIPGPLVRTWGSSSGQRLYLTRDDTYTSKQLEGGGWQWIDTATLNLLQAATSEGKPRAVRLSARAFADMSPTSMVYGGDRIYMVLGSSAYWGGYAIEDGIGRVGGVGTTGTVDDTGTAQAADTSDRLVIIDTSQGTLDSSYEQPTELSSLDLMGVQQNKLFVNLQGDGILVVDVTDASAPQATAFYRTLGWASGIEFAGSSAYVPADYYGTFRLDLDAPGRL
jgi:hypothetical protein